MPLRSPPPKRHKNRVRQNAIFVKYFKLIWVVQSSSQKYFYFGKSEIVVAYIVPSSPRGALRDRHGR
jgi:hypothetical protein